MDKFHVIYVPPLLRFILYMRIKIPSWCHRCCCLWKQFVFGSFKTIRFHHQREQRFFCLNFLFMSSLCEASLALPLKLWEFLLPEKCLPPLSNPLSISLFLHLPLPKAITLLSSTYIVIGHHLLVYHQSF